MTKKRKTKSCSSFLSLEENRPLIAFHYSCNPNPVREFAPFTHFGTLRAAFERYLQKENPITRGEDGYKNGIAFYPVRLRIKNPMLIQDHTDWRSNFINSSCLEKFSKGEQNYIADALDAKQISHEDVRRELSQAGVYKIDDSEVENRNNLERQRTLALLEYKGYDGLIYMNREEDPGSISWVNFRPQQVESVYAGPMTSEKSLVLDLPLKRKVMSSLTRFFSGAASKEMQAYREFVSSRNGTSNAEMIESVNEFFENLVEEWEIKKTFERNYYRSRIHFAFMEATELKKIVKDTYPTEAEFKWFHDTCREEAEELLHTDPEKMPEWKKALYVECKTLLGKGKERGNLSVPAMTNG